MRLAVVTHVVRENDGQGRVNLEVVRAALAKGWSVVLFATEIAPELVGHPAVKWIKISYGSLPSNVLRYQVFAWRSYQALKKYRDDYDILHVNGFITWGHSDVNAVHFVHHGWQHSGYFPYRWTAGPRALYQCIYTGLNLLLERVAFKRAHAIVAVSNRVASELRSTGIHGEIDVIYNGVDLTVFQGRQSERAVFNLPNEPFMLLFAGDLKTSRKNLDAVLQAMVGLPDEIHLAVAGGLKGSPYPQMAEALGLTGRVHFLGHVRDIPGLMLSVDSFVFPSRYDPCPLVIPEALAAGLPVVTSVRAGSSEMVGEAGVVLDDPDDIDGLRDAVKRLYLDPPLRADMKRMALESAQAHGWRSMAQKYLDLYDRVLKQKQSGLPAPQR